QTPRLRLLSVPGRGGVTCDRLRAALPRLRLSLYEQRSVGGNRMHTNVPAVSGSRRLRYLAAAAALWAALAVAPASAHFVLETPAASLEQNAIGDPQKLGPCGGTS